VKSCYNFIYKTITLGAAQYKDFIVHHSVEIYELEELIVQGYRTAKNRLPDKGNISMKQLNRSIN